MSRNAFQEMEDVSLADTPRNPFHVREGTPVPETSDFPLYEEPGTIDPNAEEVDWTLLDDWLAPDADIMMSDVEVGKAPAVSNKAYLDQAMPNRTTRELDDAPLNILQELLSVRNSSISEKLPALKAWIDGNNHDPEIHEGHKRIWLYDPAFTASDLREGLIHARNSLREARRNVREAIALADEVGYGSGTTLHGARELYAKGREVKLKLTGVTLQQLKHDDDIRERPFYVTPDIRLVIMEICKHLKPTKADDILLRREIAAYVDSEK